jgi:hypothetical protein
LLQHPITDFVHVAVLLVGAVDQIDDRGHVRQAARVREQLFERYFGELRIHLTFQFGKYVSEGGRPAQAACLDELPGE